jgi:replicative DNA helicase
LDLELLHIVSNRDQYTRFKPFIEPNVLVPEARLVYNNVQDFYTQNPGCKGIHWPAFRVWFMAYRRLAIKPEQLETFTDLFKRLEEYKPTTSTEEVLQSLVTRDYMTRIVQTAQRVRDNTIAISEMVTLVDECQHTLKMAVSPADLFVPSDSRAYVKRVLSDGYYWQLKELNISCGPLRQGDFIIVAACPETGKTTFLAHQIGHMATQIGDDRPVIWVNNEEQSDKVMMRVRQSQLGIDLKTYLTDPTGWDEKYKTIMNGNMDRVRVTTNDNAACNVDALTAMFQAYNPAIIIFDQLDKVSGFRGEEQEHSRLTKLYNWARDLSHKYGPVIAASQADASAAGVRFVGQHQLSGSKVGKPGEADAIITIGKDPTLEYARFINVPKNKLDGGGPVFDEAQRHGQWEVKIHPAIAQYEGTH